MTTQSATLVATDTRQKPRKATLEQSQRRWGWIFLSPWILGFLAFTFFPMAASLYFSFTDFTTGQPIHWIGLTNWKNLFADPTTLASLGITLRFGIYIVPVSLGFPLLLATLLNSKRVLGRPLLRTLFYMPYVIPAISGIFVWQSFLSQSTGWLDRLLRLVGVTTPPDWLYDTHFIYTALVMISLWGVGNAMLTMLAAMQGVPTELYEAAEVDGASGLLAWWRITIPMITPVIFYNLVLTVIGVMQYFTVPFVLAQNLRSDPSINFINFDLYREFFENHQMGFASTIAWFLFLVALLITLVLFASARRWVYYASGD